MDQRKYGFWRTDKPKEPGFSHELISCDYEQIKDKTSMDELECYPAGVNTIVKAFERNVKRIPEQEFLGTRNNDHYEWLTFKQTHRLVLNFAAGCQRLGFSPDVEAENKTWRFMGI